MNREELSNTLKNKAINLGLCKEWTEGWGDPDRQELIDKFLHGIDFCVDNRFPTPEFIKQNFDKELLHDNNIFVDESLHLRNLHGIAVLKGNCKGMLMFDGLAVCDLYVCDGCDVIISCSGMSKVFVNLYDNAKVTVMQKDIAGAYIYYHSEDCHYETNGDVLVRKSLK